MFTGIIEELGAVIARDDLGGEAARLTVSGPLVTADAHHGDSIAVNGVCLTVAEVGEGRFSADVMAETLRRSALGELSAGSRVNLERAVAVGDRLGGHIVQGHVDGTGRILARTPTPHWEVVRITLPAPLARYVVEKGSITVDGISLTVSALGAGDRPDDGPDDQQEDPRDWFEVSLIPTTRELTTLGAAPVGARVNLEVDVVAKYVERLLSRPAG